MILATLSSFYMETVIFFWEIDLLPSTGVDTINGAVAVTKRSANLDSAVPL